MPILGKTSKKRLEQVHQDMREFLLVAIDHCPIDFGVACGWRGKEAQNKAFAEKKSYARWGESKHNHIENGEPCSHAVDLYIWEPGRGAIWGDESKEDRRKFYQLLDWLGGYATANGIKLLIGGYRIKLADGSYDIGHIELEEDRWYVISE